MSGTPYPPTDFLRSTFGEEGFNFEFGMGWVIPLYGSAHGGAPREALCSGASSRAPAATLAAACALHASIPIPALTLVKKSSGYQHRSPERLAALAAAACRPGCSTRAPTKEGAHLGAGFPLRCFQRLSVPGVAGRRCRWSTTAPPEARPPRSSRTRGGPPQLPLRLRRIGTELSRRSEPSSRTALNGEQPYPWDLLQPQDAMSRHRGAKPCRRCGLLGKISLLSPEYLLSVERRPFHSEPPDH